VRELGPIVESVADRLVDRRLGPVRGGLLGGEGLDRLWFGELGEEQLDQREVADLVGAGHRLDEPVVEALAPGLGERVVPAAAA